MQNEYGVKLDRNEYAPSIMQDDDACYLCGRTTGKRDRHEPFGGANRRKSKQLGMWCYLCHDACHLNGVHRDAQMAEELRKITQAAAMNHYGWSIAEFIRRFGKNHI